jgi:DNA-binding GntR family transcriptional regulator
MAAHPTHAVVACQRTLVRLVGIPSSRTGDAVHPGGARAYTGPMAASEAAGEAGSHDESASDSTQARVVEALRRAIVNGELGPRSQVSESALAAVFGTSRTPIREALKQLEIEGLVKIIPRVGTFVTEPSWQEIVELSQVSEMLNALAARLVAQRGDQEVLAVLERNMAEAREALTARDVQRYVSLVREFHDVLVRGANNNKLLSHYQILMNQFPHTRLVFASLQQPERFAASVDEHEAILRAIEARDPDAAELAMRSHSTQSRRALASSVLASSEMSRGESTLKSLSG